MEWLERFNQAITYIEENLAAEIDYDVAARIACCSTFHFQRMFSYIAGVTLSEYIRHRRMTLAAFDLQSRDAKVIDLALKYGYESPTSFTRAFQSVHKLPPSAAKAEGAKLKAYPRISFSISIKGDVEMNYWIEKKAAFRIVGVTEHIDMEKQDGFARVPQFYAETLQSGKINQILALMAPGEDALLGVTSSIKGSEFDYYIAVKSDMAVPEGMAEFVVPEALWAVFECVGPMPSAIQELQKRVVTEWLPSSGYEYADAPDIEVYPSGNITAADYRSEVWLPVVKKN